MKAEELRKLKHELRTPVNHIMGYSSLLLENADDFDDHITAELARSIHTSGEMLAKLLEKNLLSTSTEIDDAQMEALRESVRPVVKQILEILSSRSAPATVDVHANDLDRIRHAANKLLTLLTTDRVPVSD